MWREWENTLFCSFAYLRMLLVVLALSMRGLIWLGEAVCCSTMKSVRQKWILGLYTLTNYISGLTVDRRHEKN